MHFVPNYIRNHYWIIDNLDSVNAEEPLLIALLLYILVTKQSNVWICVSFLQAVNFIHVNDAHFYVRTGITALTQTHKKYASLKIQLLNESKKRNVKKGCLPNLHYSSGRLQFCKSPLSYHNDNWLCNGQFELTKNGCRYENHGACAMGMPAHVTIWLLLLTL